MPYLLLEDYGMLTVETPLQGISPWFSVESLDVQRKVLVLLNDVIEKSYRSYFCFLGKSKRNMHMASHLSWIFPF